MSNTELIDIFLSVAEDIAEGMQDPQFKQFPWGFIFDWETHPLPQANFSLINSIPDDISDLTTWFQDNSKIYSNENLDPSSFESLNDTFHLLIRKNAKLKTPFLPDYTISHFNLGSRNLQVSSFQLTKAASKLFEGSEREQDLIEQYLSATLHMRSGEIWVLDDNDSNTICSVVIAKAPKSELFTIEYAQTHPKYANTLLLKHLISHVISHHGKKSDVMASCEASSTLKEIFMSLDFTIVESLNIFKIVELA